MKPFVAASFVGPAIKSVAEGAIREHDD